MSMGSMNLDAASKRTPCNAQATINLPGTAIMVGFFTATEQYAGTKGVYTQFLAHDKVWSVHLGKPPCILVVVWYEGGGAVDKKDNARTCRSLHAVRL
jgi:hypothetical protein